MFNECALWLDDLVTKSELDMRHAKLFPIALTGRSAALSAYTLSTPLPTKRHRPLLALAGLITMMVSGCSLAPQTMPMDARALGNGNMALAADVIPTQALRIRRGVGERFELGVQLEPVMITGFGKLTVLQRKAFAAALYAAGTYGPDKRYSARSLQVGPLLTYSHERFDAAISIRHSSVDYSPAEPGSFGVDEPGIEVLSNDLDSYYTADLSLSWRLGGSGARLKTGVTCTSYQLAPEENGVQGCVPVIGLLAAWPN